MNNTTYPIKLELRIDWADLDLFGHVNNVAFFRYIQAARVNYCEQIGLSSLLDGGDDSFMVVSSHCQYKKPLLYPGSVTIVVKADWLRNSSFQLSYQIINSGQILVAEATDILVVFDHRQKEKKLISKELRKKFEQLEGRRFESETP